MRNKLLVASLEFTFSIWPSPSSVSTAEWVPNWPTAATFYGWAWHYNSRCCCRRWRTFVDKCPTETWQQFDVIERHQGSSCYLPCKDTHLLERLKPSICKEKGNSSHTINKLEIKWIMHYKYNLNKWSTITKYHPQKSYGVPLAFWPEDKYIWAVLNWGLPFSNESISFLWCSRVAAQTPLQISTVVSHMSKRCS